jgi:hypothetical protein
MSGPGRFSVWVPLASVCLSSAAAFGFWCSQFGLGSFVLVLLFLLVLLLFWVQAVASAIVALIRGSWRKIVSNLSGVAAGLVIIPAAVAVPVELQFSLVARSHYEAELARLGNPDRHRWLLDAQFLGPDETNLVYDKSDGEGPPDGARSTVEDSAGCSLYTERLGGHFYREFFSC